MKYLLIPVTMFIWYLITYYAALFGMVLLLWLFDLDWVWVILGFSFLIGLISLLVNVLPSIINNLIIDFYGLNWFTALAHSIAGLIAIIYLYYLIYHNPANSINENYIEDVSVISALWDVSALKTIILVVPFIGLQLGIIYQSIISPISMKIDNKQSAFELNIYKE